MPRRQDDDGIAEIVGQVLVLGITVGLLGVVTAFFFLLPPPTQTPHLELSIAIGPGNDGQWDQGNEDIRIRHLGGDPLHESTTTIFAYAAQLTTWEGATLGSAFTDGSFEIGETWIRTLQIPPASTVRVEVIDATGLVFSDSITAGGNP